MIEAKDTIKGDVSSNQSLNGRINNSIVVQKYELPIASKDVLGGIKIGENLTIDEDGTLNAVGGNGEIVEESDPTVPTHVKAITKDQIERWNNGTGDVDLTDYAKKTELPTKVSQLTNDENYINQIKTINGNSLVGEGNLVIEGGSGGSSNVVVSPTEPTNGEEVWFQKSVNLFDKSKAVNKGRIISTGAFQCDENNACSSEEYTPVKPNTQYTISGVNDSVNTNGRWYHYFYDANKNPVSGVIPQKGTQTVTTPENAYYMRFTFPYTDLNTFQVEKGSTASDYQEYAEDKIYTLTNNGYTELNTNNKIGTYVQINNSATLSLEPETVTKLDFDNENKNTTDGGIIFENSGVRIGKGVSQILIIAKWNNWKYDFAKYIYVYKNGVAYEMQPYPLNVYSANITSYMDVVEGDYIEIYGWHDSTTKQNINSNPASTDAKIIIMR